MNIKKLAEQLDKIISEDINLVDKEHKLFDELQKICIKKGLEYTKYSDSFVIKPFIFDDDYHTTIDELTIYFDGSIDIRQNGTLSLTPKNFNEIIDLLDLVDRYKEV